MQFFIWVDGIMKIKQVSVTYDCASMLIQIIHSINMLFSMEEKIEALQR